MRDADIAAATRAQELSNWEWIIARVEALEKRVFGGADRLSWTSDLPSKEGWYWGETADGPELMRVAYRAPFGDEFPSGFVAWHDGHWFYVDMDVFGRWAGPIPEPIEGEK